MAQHVTQFVKRPSGTGAIQVKETLRELAIAPIEMRSVPLRLSPLLARYKGHGRIAIRVERLPHRSRLSAGQNNGDQSWSVSLDELEDLAYQFPSDLHDAPILAIRVINRDGATVAVLDYQVSPSDASSEIVLQSGEAMRALAEETIRSLRDELTKAKEELSSRESAFVELQQRAARNWDEQSRKLVGDALVSARSQWDTELAKQLAAAADRSESSFEEVRRTWQTEYEARLAESERRAHELYTQARERWQREAETALAVAQEGWKAGEASRLSAAEARWHNDAATALADARAAAARSQGDHAELARLRAELAGVKRLLSGSELELAKSRSDAEQERAGWRQGTETAIARAQKAWKAEETARLATAEAHWREQSATMLAEAVAARKRAEAALLDARASSKPADGNRDQAELLRLQDELTALQSALADRRSEFALAREQWRQETDAKLAQAKKEWKADEYNRLAAAETRWRDQSAIALAEAAASQKLAETALVEATAKLEARIQPGEDELRRLQDKVASIQSALAHREAEFAQAGEQWLQESQAKLAQAKDEWRADGTVRLAEAEARIRRESKIALDAAIARAETAEAELAELRARPKTETESNDHVTILRLRDELEKLRIAVDVRDIELRNARSATAQAMARLAGESQPVEQRAHPGSSMWPGRRNKHDQEEKASRPLWRDIALVAGLAALVTVLYPTIVSLLPDDWVSQDGSGSDVPAPAHATTGASGKPALRSTPAVAAQPSDTVIRSANVHADPSASSAVLARLPRDTKIAPIEQRGNWVRVSISGLDGTHKQQGWVFASFLKAAPDGQKALDAELRR